MLNEQKSMSSLTRRSLLAQTLASAAATSLAAESAALRLPKKIRIALIGFEGHVSEITGPLPQLPDVELVACATPNDAVWSAQKNPAVRAARRYRTGQELLAKEQDLDLVAVCNDNGSRAAMVRACLQRGVHVAAEKPLALTREELAGIRADLSQSGKKLTMLLPMRYSPPFLALRQMVKEGVIGDVVQMETQKSYQIADNPLWKRRRATYGSTILWLAPHLVDLMLFTSGRNINQVACRQSHVAFPEIEDMENTTAAIYRLDNGGTATMHMDFLRPAGSPTHGDDRLRLAGTKGVLEYQEHQGITLQLPKAKSQTVTSLPAERSLFKEFLGHVYLGQPSSLTEQEIWRVSEIVLSTEEASRNGSWVNA